MLKNRSIRLFLEIVLAILAILMLTALVRSAFLFYYRSAYPTHYSELVMEKSALNGVEPSLVYAVIRTESGFNPDASSSVEARGLMQITEETFAWAQMRDRAEETLAFEALYDTSVNIHYGTVLLRLYLDEFGTVENALCAYHAGRGSLMRWLGNPAYSTDGVHLDTIPFRDTAYYVDRVLNTKQTYERLYQF